MTDPIKRNQEKASSSSNTEPKKTKKQSLFPPREVIVFLFLILLPAPVHIHRENTQSLVRPVFHIRTH